MSILLHITSKTV